VKFVEIIPKNHTLYIKSDDRQTGLFDVKPYLELEYFTPLKNKNKFDHIHNERHFNQIKMLDRPSMDTIQTR